MTALYDKIIYGPVRSRRLGISLGVNLLPTTAKVCSFDCIYCECGWNDEHRATRKMCDTADLRTALEEALQAMQSSGELPDVITFAGNGEPTMHPSFDEIIDITIALRDKYAPQAKIAVLSNATQLGREDVCRALRRVDNSILKIDSAIDATARIMNRPQGHYRVEDIVQAMQSFRGEFILQTMFLRGECEGVAFDNTTEQEVEAWLQMVERLQPRQVMVYSIARDTPCKTLQKVSTEELSAIAERVRQLGIECSVV